MCIFCCTSAQCGPYSSSRMCIFMYFEGTSHNKLRVPPRKYSRKMQTILQFARNYLQKTVYTLSYSSNNQSVN